MKKHFLLLSLFLCCCMLVIRPYANAQQLSGTYTINPALPASASNFQSIKAAVDTLIIKGVNNRVTFNIASGTYPGTVAIPAIAGASAANTITFQSAANHADSVTISAALTLNSASYFHFKRVTVTTTLTIAGGSSYDSISSCKINVTSGRAINADGVTGGKHVFINNIISSSSDGIYLGTNVLGSPNYTDSNMIAYNTISGTATGISVYNARYTHIYNNQVSSVSSWSIGLNFSPYSDVINNIATNTGTGTFCQAMYSYKGAFQRYYHNTAIAQSMSGSSNCVLILYNAAGDSANEWKNNIIVQTGGQYAVNISGNTPGTANSWDYNLYYTTGTNLFLNNGATYPYSSWQTINGQDAHSVVLNPGFVSTTDFHLSNRCGKQGIFLAAVSTDLEGSSRNNPPTIGAYESTGSLDDIGMETMLEPSLPIIAGTQNLKVRLRNTGTNPVTSFNIRYVLNGGAPVTQPWTGTIAPCDTISVTIPNVTLSNGDALTIYTTQPNGTGDTKKDNDTLKTVINIALSGTYTIGLAGANFASFNAAVAALNLRGVSDPVVFNVQKGTYNEQVSIPAIGGASATNTITFKSADNNADSVVLGYTDPNFTYGVNLNSARYIHLKYLTIKDKPFALTGSASYDSITYCKFNNQILANFQTWNSLGFSGNFSGKSNVFSYNYAGAGISIQANDGVTADSNVITNNTIQTASGASLSLLSTSFTFVANNNIAQTATGADQVYAVNSYHGTNQRFYHNTITSLSSHILSAPVSIDYNAANNQWKNNIIANMAGVGNGYAIYFASNPGTNFISDYNVYYNTKNGANVIYFSNVPVAYTLPAWRGVNAQDAHSVFINPGFLSTTNLHLTNSCGKSGTPLAAVTTDIENNPRNNPPTIGAYEHFGDDNIAVETLLQPSFPVFAGPQDIKVRVRNAGDNPVTSFNISYVLNNGSPVTIPYTPLIPLSPCDTLTVTFTGINQANLLSANTLVVYTHQPNGASDTQKANDTLKTTLYVALSGNYIIGDTSNGAHFPSFSKAISALIDGGIAASVVFNVQTKTYTEQVIIPAIAGVSDSAIITFQSAAQNADSVKLTYAAAASIPVVTLNNASYIRFKYLTIAPTTTTGRAFQLNGTASSNSITYCKISSVNDGIYTLTSNPVFSGKKNVFSYNTITANTNGIYINATTSFYSDSNVISYNTIQTTGTSNTYGLYISFTSNLIISNNQIKAGAYGLYQINGNNNSQVVNNTITGGNNHAVYNYFGSSQKFYHNTIIAGATFYGTYIRYDVNSSGNQWRNNIITHSGTGGALAIVDNAGSNNSWDYNLYYTNGTFPFYQNTGSIFLPAFSGRTLADRRAIVQDSHSVVLSPSFVSTTDLHLISSCGAKGIMLPTVTADIEGTTRNNPPIIGAYEYNSVNDIAAEALINLKKGSIVAGLQNLTVRVRNAGTAPVTSFTLSYVLNGGSVVSQSWTGSLASCDTAVIVFTGSNRINLNSSGANALTVYTSNLNGSTPDDNRRNDTLATPLYVALNGPYTIGATGSDFNSFNAAVNALNQRGVSGPVVFNVKSANYTEQLNIIPVDGASAVNTITFQSIANHPDSVKLQYALGTTQALVTLNAGVSYINFKNLTISSTTAGGSGYVFDLIGTASNNSITYCTISTGGNANNDNAAIRALSFSGRKNIFSNNTISGRYAIQIISPATLVHADSTVIAYNNISTHYGLWLEYADYSIVNANRIISTTNQAVYLNTIKYGIFTNNTIRGNTYGIYSSIGSGASNRFYHNTISAVTYAVNVRYNVADSSNEWRNNVIMSETNNALYFYNGIVGTQNTWDYNLYYSGISNIFNTASTLALWQLTNQDKHSIVYRPAFLSADNLLPNPADSASWALNGRAVLLDSTVVGLDINGNPRPTTLAKGVPDIGACEFTPTVLPPLANAIPDFITPYLTMDTTQVFLFAGDTVAKITWKSFNDIPRLQVRQYSGTKPLAVGAAQNYMYFYTDISATGSGVYIYDIDLYYRKNWTGTNPVENDIRLAKQDAGNPWHVVGLSSPNTVRGILRAELLGSFSQFSGTDMNNPMPVKLVSFNGKKVKTDVALNWTTVSETNSDHFEIERSFDGKRFEKTGKISAAGKSNILLNYKYTDMNPTSGINTPVVYYRIRMVDIDGSSEYSNIVSVNWEDKNTEEKVSVYPNPFTDQTFISITLADVSSVRMEITDITGRILSTEEYRLSQGVNTLQLNATNLNQGVYFVTMEHNGLRTVNKIIKQ